MASAETAHNSLNTNTFVRQDEPNWYTLETKLKEICETCQMDSIRKIVLGSYLDGCSHVSGIFHGIRLQKLY